MRLHRHPFPPDKHAVAGTAVQPMRLPAAGYLLFPDAFSTALAVKLRAVFLQRRIQTMSGNAIALRTFRCEPCRHYGLSLTGGIGAYFRAGRLSKPFSASRAATSSICRQSHMQAPMIMAGPCGPCPVITSSPLQYSFPGTAFCSCPLATILPLDVSNWTTLSPFFASLPFR